ncbi:Tc toxin subunit A [Pseudomonas sp. D1-2]|uniref:Tc toxin subunit A n=1 Tax=unclassified Pseudomonas TaxID=196821 RepID=UPI003DA820D3
MKASPVDIAKSFYAPLADEQNTRQLAALDQYLDDGGSICALARKGIMGLVSEYELDIDDAQAISLRLNGLATWVLRRFIESQLVLDEPLPAHLRQGLLALVDGPTYADVFKPKFGARCPWDAIEAIHSPVAYTVWLKHWSEQRFRPTEQAYPLYTRRVDLGRMSIDPVAVHGVVSSVEVVSGVLEASIKDSLGQSTDIDRTLSERRYPNGLPYHHPWTSLDEFARDLGMSVGTVVEMCDPVSPYFLREELPWGATADNALIQSARLNPGLREILTEDRHFPNDNDTNDEKEAFYKANFGLLDVEPLNLNQAYFFNQRTKLNQSALEALLSVELFATTVSEHVIREDDLVTPGHAGSVFVNDGPANTMSIDYGAIEPLNFIRNYSEDRVDRLNRKIRLDNAMQLPSHETDALLIAIIRAELDPTSRDTSAPSYWMTSNTVRAMGLFQRLRERYHCTAEEFAAFLDAVSIYGRGTELSQFDRVFNPDTLAIPPLVLDDSKFELVPAEEADAFTVMRICSGLNIDLATYLALAPLIERAHGELKRSLAVISSFYRMARLPQVLGIAPSVAAQILDLLSGDSWQGALAGRPYINTDSLAQSPDSLTQIQRLEGWIRWCADSELDEAWALEQVRSVLDPSEPSQVQSRLFEQVRAQLSASLFTEAALHMAGVEPLSNGRQWTNHLLGLADRDGLVIHRAETDESPYETYAREQVELVVGQLIGQGNQQTVEKILGVLLSSRAGQQAVVREGLAVFSGLASALVLQVLSWSGGTVHRVLSYIWGRTTAVDPSAIFAREEDVPGDPFLGMLDGFAQRSEVAKRLKLSPEFLALYLNIGDGVGNVPGTSPFLPSALYYLTVYNRAVALSQTDESQLLSYLELVNKLPDNLANHGLSLVQEHTAQLLAELFDWSVEEVRACAARVNPKQGYIRNLEHFDLFTRLRAFSLESTLDALTTLKLGTLVPDARFEAYQTVAEQVAAVLADPKRSSPLYGIDAVNDEVTVDCSIEGPTELVANSGQTTELTVTVTKGGEAQRNVNVYFSAKLCSVEPPIATTNEHGLVRVTVRAGTAMGRDVISYRLDAREPQPGVIINLVHDSASIEFYIVETDFLITEEKIGNDVTLRAQLLDRRGNPIVNAPVTWRLPPVTGLPIYVSTNAQGLTEVTFTSLEAATVDPTVDYDLGGAGLLFQPIVFKE